MNIRRSYVRACAGLPVVLVLLTLIGFLADIKVNMGTMSIGLIVVIGLWVLIDRLTQGINVEDTKKNGTHTLFGKAKDADAEVEEDADTEAVSLADFEPERGIN
jgi:ABC-type nickel/cobalt efflux system permease component RcnA